jgi:hypothetical protein
MYEVMKQASRDFPGKRPYIFLDAWSDMCFESEETNSVNKILNDFKSKVEKHKVGMMVSAHIRKTDKRPTLQDIYGTARMGFVAQWACMIENEARTDYDDVVPVMWSVGDNLCPIITGNIVKSKVSTWGGTQMIWALDDNCCQLYSLTRDEYCDVVTQYHSDRSRHAKRK